MEWHTGSAADVISAQKTDIQKGLTSQEAKKRLEENGPNKLREKAKKTFLQRFFAQLSDTMVIILLIAAAISIALNIYNASVGNEADWAEPIVIVAIVLINAFLGVIQESKAEAALEALKKMSAPTALVLRDGVTSRVDASEIVTGDVIVLDAGDMVPADARIIKCSSLKCDEASLTGESVPAEKSPNDDIGEKVPLGDRVNMVFSGCAVANGRATAVVVRTGMDTEMGKIATMLENENEGDTPLQRKLAQLGKYLGFLALGICAVIFAIGIVDKLPLLEMFMTAVSLAVAAIPEGLPAIVTIVLAIGVQRMVKKNAIIRRLPAVETLGSASVICSDKTGTLTLNHMTLVKLYADGDAQETVDNSISDRAREVLKLAALCCDGTVREEMGQLKHIGDPTETAIVAAAHNLRMKNLSDTYERVYEIPFDSDRKLMTTINIIDGKNVVIVKGAPDILFSLCVKGDIEDAVKENADMARNAIRVLGVGTKIIDKVPEPECDPKILESDLTFVGLVGMIDPPREEVKVAIAECRKAGITPVMITGDHVITAKAIAQQLGMMNEDDLAITGAQLEAIPEDELRRDITKYKVYARVTPTDKIRIVKAWQARGDIAAMTGDGVNDAPALKAADIGCAMGITGTDVAKGAADMTLTDDNFATIVHAVKEGRGIYDNIRKAVRFLLSCNLGEIVTVFVSMLVWKESPLMPIQLLWINLVTDSLPALALGVEPVEYDVMDRKPRDKKEGLFANGVGLACGVQGMIIGILTLIAYFIGSRAVPLLEAGTFGFMKALTLSAANANIPLGETMAFAVLAISQLVHANNVRSSHSLFKVGPFSNKYMVGAFFASLSLMLVVLFVPFLQNVFNVVSMTAAEWLIVAGLSLSMFVIMELTKLVKFIFRKKQ